MEEVSVAPKYRLRRTRGIATVRDVADWLSWLGSKLRNSFRVEIEGAKRSEYQTDGTTHSVFVMDRDWSYAINAQIIATQNTTGLPADSGLFLAGVESGATGVADQGDFQSYSQVVEYPTLGLYRRIAVTLYASSILNVSEADDGYKGDIIATLELEGVTSGVYETFDVTITEAGVNFTKLAPTPDEFYFLRFVSAVYVPVTGVIQSNGGEDVFLNPSKKPFRLPAGGVLHAETLTALIKWVEASLTYKPPDPPIEKATAAGKKPRKSTPSKPTYKIGRKGGFAYVSDARDIIKWLAKRMAEKV